MERGEEKGKKNKKRKKDIEWYNKFFLKIFIEFESFSNWAWEGFQVLWIILHPCILAQSKHKNERNFEKVERCKF